MLASSLQDMGFQSSLADPDVWLRPAVEQTGETYYEYIFVYVDDLLVLSVNPQIIMKTISSFYRLKEGSVGKPTNYLGAQIKEYRNPTNPTKVMWSMSADKYIQEALRTLQFDLDRLGVR
jgi:hypothetical protein